MIRRRAGSRFKRGESGDAETGGYLHVLHDFEEQVAHPVDACFKRLEPPPMPKAEMHFRTSRPWQDGQDIWPPPVIETSSSK